jgi:transcriptional regulator with PAS, ATPase and Fis domain
MVNMMKPDGILTKDTLPENILSQRLEKKEVDKQIYTLKELEKKAIGEALNICGWSTEGKKLVALKLGIGIATLYRKIEEYNLSK